MTTLSYEFRAPACADSSFLRVSIAALVLFSLVLPTGSFYGFPFKHLAYIACLYGLFQQWLRGKAIPFGIINLFLSVSIFFSFFMLLGAVQAVSSFGHVMMEGVGVFTAVTVVLIVLAARSVGAVSDQDVLVYAFWGAFLFALWKVAVVLSLVFGVVLFSDVYAFFMSYVGYRPVTSGIFGGLVRFNLIIYDFVVAVFLFLIPAFPRVFSKVPSLIRALFMLVGTACLVFAFSRLLFGMVFLLWLYLVFVKVSFRVKLIVLLFVGISVLVSFPWLEGAYEQRFKTESTAVSDSIRAEQIDALLDEWSNMPFIGGGFGYHSKTLIRDPAVPFSYEVQWVGFLAKFGAIGISFLLLLVCILFYCLLSKGRVLDHYVLGFILLGFILGGFTNQYLVSSASGVFYAVVLSMGALLRCDLSCEDRREG